MKQGAVRIYVLVEDHARKRGFLGQHGFSALVEVGTGRDVLRVLVDTGQDGSVVLSNASRLGLDLSKVDAIFITHGHYDHMGGLPTVLEHVRRKGVLVVAHPDAFVPKFAYRNGKLVPGSPGKLTPADLEEKGAIVVLSKRPVRLSNNVVTTGEVKRQTDFERVKGFLKLGPDGLEEDKLLDDQALVIDTPKGLVVITGCAHSGVVNTVLHARELMGKEEVYAVIGGFHLEGASEERIARTVEELANMRPEHIYACHCTGPRAFCAFLRAFGERARWPGSGDVIELA